MLTAQFSPSLIISPLTSPSMLTAHFSPLLMISPPTSPLTLMLHCSAIRSPQTSPLQVILPLPFMTMSPSMLSQVILPAFTSPSTTSQVTLPALMLPSTLWQETGNSEQMTSLTLPLTSKVMFVFSFLYSCLETSVVPRKRTARSLLSFPHGSVSDETSFSSVLPKRASMETPKISEIAGISAISGQEMAFSHLETA